MPTWTNIDLKENMVGNLRYFCTCDGQPPLFLNTLVRTFVVTCNSATLRIECRTSKLLEVPGADLLSRLFVNFLGSVNGMLNALLAIGLLARDQTTVLGLSLQREFIISTLEIVSYPDRSVNFA